MLCLLQDCLKLLAALLRQSEAYRPTTGQLRFLLGWVFGDMEEASASPTSFALLKVGVKAALAGGLPHADRQ